MAICGTDTKRYLRWFLAFCRVLNLNDMINLNQACVYNIQYGMTPVTPTHVTSSTTVTVLSFVYDLPKQTDDST